MITARELVGVLKAKKSGDGWIARCPVRDSHANGDRKPSLSIGERDGVLLLKCHVGCSFEKILAAIPHVNNGSRGRREIAHFNYRDETGKLLYQCVRFDPKQFLQRQPGNGGDWVWNLKGVRRVPYRLPELIAADPAETVFIAEGEGKCDALAARGLVATTGAGGALKWRDAYNKHLAGRNVAILPDNDGPGHEHGEQVANSLLSVAASVKIVSLPGLSEKGDIVNWLTGGNDVDALMELVKVAPVFQKTGACGCQWWASVGTDYG